MESDPEHNPAILNPGDPSRLAQEAENMVVEVIYKPPGNHNQDPGDEPITYALLQMGGQLIGALWIATTGASGFFAAASAGDLGLDYQAIWATRATEARIRYALAEEEWDARSWLDYWLERISGTSGGVALGEVLEGDYEEVRTGIERR